MVDLKNLGIHFNGELSKRIRTRTDKTEDKLKKDLQELVEHLVLMDLAGTAPIFVAQNLHRVPERTKSAIDAYRMSRRIGDLEVAFTGAVSLTETIRKIDNTITDFRKNINKLETLQPPSIQPLTNRHLPFLPPTTKSFADVVSSAPSFIPLQKPQWVDSKIVNPPSAHHHHTQFVENTDSSVLDDSPWEVVSRKKGQKDKNNNNMY